MIRAQDAWLLRLLGGKVESYNGSVSNPETGLLYYDEKAT